MQQEANHNGEFIRAVVGIYWPCTQEHIPIWLGNDGSHHIGYACQSCNKSQARSYKDTGFINK